MDSFVVNGRIRADSDSEAAAEVRKFHPLAKRITIRLIEYDWYEYAAMMDVEEVMEGETDARSRLH